MAKTYIDTVKYIITASFDIEGLVEKPDIIGAIFGQTEGLIGDELELRELQKNGKIGRIEVDLHTKNGHTSGKIYIPSSLDMAETAILAATLETVDKVGPCQAKMVVEKVEDTRAKKREFIADRAAEILRKLLNEEIPESQEITEMVQTKVRQAEIRTYGEDKLAAGPAIEDSPNIILVEGRADVLNLLKHGIHNAIAIGGARVPKTIIELCKQKTVTAFVDGDRGGDIILRNLDERADIDFVTKAPAGKEVEELTRKEILQALRRKVPIDQYHSMHGDFKETKETKKKEQAQPTPKEDTINTSENTDEEKLKEILAELNESLKARILDKELNTIEEVPVRNLITTLRTSKISPYAVVFDGIVTNRLVELAERKKIHYIVGIKEGNIQTKPRNVKIICQM